MERKVDDGPRTADHKGAGCTVCSNQPRRGCICVAQGSQNPGYPAEFPMSNPVRVASVISWEDLQEREL